MIETKIQQDPYRFLICADKFQTGYDEPLLHTMYVDKTLSDIKAVQTLSRLNRAHPQKTEVFVLDFVNGAEVIANSFARFYRTTILSSQTDPNRLYDLQADLEETQVYTRELATELADRFLQGAGRDELDPELDGCVEFYRDELGGEEQVDFKSKAKGFVRSYSFLSSILPYNNADWERTFLFLNLLLPKLPSPKEEDLSQGILDSVDMESYRIEKHAMQQILLPDADAEIEPVPTSGGAHLTEPDLDPLSEIIETFNRLFGDIQWADSDRVLSMITETIPDRVSQDKAYQNAQKNSDPQNARVEYDRALFRVMTAIMKDDTELFKKFVDDTHFKRWISDTVFRLTYNSQPKTTN